MNLPVAFICWTIAVDADRESIIVSWDSQAGRTYRVEYTDSLNADDWHPLAEGIRSESGTAQFEEGHLANRQRFYRVVEEQ